MDDKTVELALKAYDDGYRIIAGWFNEAFDARKIGVRIEADPPPPKVTIGDCQLRLSNLLIAFRPLCPDLSFDDQLCPWVVGYVLGERDQAGDKVSGIALRGDSWLSTAEEVERIVGVKHSYGWKNAGPWRANVIEPMEWHANEWREWLQQDFGSLTAPVTPPPQDDDRDYVSATEIRTDHTPDGCDLDNKQLNKFLAHHTEIRTTRPLKADGTPRVNRLLVHLGDWTKHQPAFREWYDAMRKPKRVSEEEVAKRTAALRTRKQARK